MADINWINFGKYGVAGEIVVPTLTNIQTAVSIGTLVGEWTSIYSAVSGASVSFSFNPTFAAARFGVGIAMNAAFSLGSTPGGFINMTLPGGSRSRIIGGIAVTPQLVVNSLFGILLSDGVGTPQIGIAFNATGQIEVLSGGNTNGSPTTVIATSTASVSAGTSHWLEWDITINNSTGAYTIKLDGITVIGPVTGANTRGGSTNNSANAFALWISATGAFGQANLGTFGEALYLFDSTGGTNNAIYGVATVGLQLATGDSSIQFAVGQGTLGYWWTGSVSTNAPGANELVLVPVTPEVNCTLNSITIIPGATSAPANFKGVIYPNSANKPDGQALASSGTQVTGAVSGTPITLPLVTPQSLTGGTQYWIGYITDTSVALDEAFSTGDPLLGRKAANTYASGAPATCPTTTAGQPTWSISGNTSGQTTNYSEVNLLPPPGARSYVTSSAVSNADLYTVGALPSNTASIAGVKISGFIMDSDAGPRTVNLQVDSGGTLSGGSNAGLTPPTSFEWENTFFDTDPNTSSAWTRAGFDAITFGPKIDS